MNRITKPTLAIGAALCALAFPLREVEAQNCLGFSDSFSGPNGSPPNPAFWGLDFDCSQVSASQTIQGGRLIQSGCIGSTCAAGCSGVSLNTLRSFNQFDLAVTFAGSTLPAHGGSFHFNVYADDALNNPPSATCSGPGPFHVAGFDVLPSGFVRIWSDYAVNVVTSHRLQPGDRFHMRGASGGTLELFLNGVSVLTQPNWNIAPKFYCSLGMSADVVGECMTAEWDDFVSIGAIETLGQGCVGSGGCTATLEGAGCLTPGSLVTFTASNVADSRFSVWFFGTAAGTFPICPSCSLVINPNLPLIFALPTSGPSGPCAGSVGLFSIIPGGIPSLDLYMQVVVSDPLVPCHTVATNGLALHFP